MFKDAETGRAYHRTWVRNRREEWLRSRGGCCEFCGAEGPLEVHHLNPLTKITHRVWTWTRRKRERELRKCVAICEFCHKRETARQQRRAGKMGQSFCPTRHQNMLRDAASGVYYLNMRVGERVVRRSLRTVDEKRALVRLEEQVRREREQADFAARGRQGAGEITVAGMAALLLEEIRGLPAAEMAEQTRVAYGEIVRMLGREFPEFMGAKVCETGAENCVRVTRAIREKFSPQRYNRTVGVIRAIFDLAVRLGDLRENPARCQKAGLQIDRARVGLKRLVLPTEEQFKSLLAYLDARSQEYGSAAPYFVRFLAFSGCRLKEAQQVRWEDVNWDRDEIMVRTGKQRGGVAVTRRVPFIGPMRELLTELREITGKNPDGLVLPIGTVKVVLAKALKRLGLPHISHHDLRHLFATRCIESGVDIPTVARWLGHQDGGALAMRVYGHLRDDHSKAMARKVRFG